MFVAPTNYTKQKLIMLVFIDLFMLFFSYFALQDLLISFTIFFIVFLIIFNIFLASGRTINLNQNGCEIKFLFVKKTYFWNELKVKKIEKHNMIFGFDVPPELTCIIFSKKKYFKPRFISPAMFCELVPFCFDYIYLNLIPENYDMEKLPTNYSVYPVDEKLFYSKMKEWNIELEK